MLIISPDGLTTRLVTVDSWTMTFWRGLFTGIGMILLLSGFYRAKTLAKFRAIGWPGLLLATMAGVGSAFFIYSITHTTVANTLLIVNTSPVFAALIARWLLKEVVTLRTWIVIIIVLVGVVIIAGADRTAGGSLAGNVAALWVAISMAGTFSLTRHFRDRDMVPGVALGGFVSATVTFPFAQPGLISSGDLLILAGVGLVMLPLSFALMFIGPRYVPAPEVSLMMLLEAILGPLWVWLVLAEKPGPYTLIGGTIIILTLAGNAIITVVRTRTPWPRV